jgi:hypothetical protein
MLLFYYYYGLYCPGTNNVSKDRWVGNVLLFFRGLIEGTVTTEVLSFQNWRKKEDRIRKSPPFQEQTLTVWISFG